MGWDAYFESLFQRIDRKVLDEDKVKYQGICTLLDLFIIWKIETDGDV